MAQHPVTVRLDEAAVKRLERVAEAMSKRAAGVAVKRGTAVRVAVDRGLAVLEAELGLTKRNANNKKGWPPRRS